jgi:hypothetical protein
MFRRNRSVTLALASAFFLAMCLPVCTAQSLIISEFMAANNSGLRDEDGDTSDWVEIYNAAPEPASLAGWHLSNDPQRPRQWAFPAVQVPGLGFLVVFASGKDRRIPTAPLHASFQLNREGEYLALFRPDGAPAAPMFSPAYPRQLSDVSYGVAMTTNLTVWVATTTPGRMTVPTDGRWGAAWVDPGFSDVGWSPVLMGVGYDRTTGLGGPASEPLPPLEDVTRPTDPITPTSNNSPANEEVDKAIDGNSRTKYLNFDKLNAGFTVTPSAGPSVVSGLRLTSANDAPERDPTSYLLAGSEDGKLFTEIARGPIPDFSGRFVTVEVSFTNAIAYRHYRLLFPTVRHAASAVAVQIAEVEFLGRVGPAPAAFAELIQSNVEAPLFGRSASLYLRFAFAGRAIEASEQLILRTQSDDGWVAFLNGVEVARANAPAKLDHLAAAVTNRSRLQAVGEEIHDLSRFRSVLRPGTNMLALQALNESADSPDFLLRAQLESVRVTLGEIAYFETGTPENHNGAGRLGLVEDPHVDPPRGFYEEPLQVTISCATPGVTLRYTANGEPPTVTSGTRYTVPITINRTTVLRVIAFREGWRESRAVTHTFLFPSQVVQQTRTATLAAGFPSNWGGRAADYGLDSRVVGPAGQDTFGGKYARTFAADLQALPSLSVVMAMDDLFGPQGIYANPENRGDAWERPASVELLYPDGREGFHEDAGLRIQGGAFRRFDLTLKKSFRLVFREKYGRAKLRYPWFGPKAAAEFDNVVLRANSNDAWPYGGSRALYVRDAFAMETARAMGRIAPHTTFVHLYLNGFYWGLYNPVERPDAAFSASYHGGDKATWDAINQDSAPDGNYEAWNRLLALLNQGMAVNANYQRIQGNDPDGTRNPGYDDLLDMENMIDYLILNFYVGNTDWPGRNWWVGRNRDNGDGFQFYPWDTETALGFSGLEADVTGVNSAVARPYAAVRANPDFRLLFADRAHRHFSPGGALYVDPAASAWDPAHPERNLPAARFAALAEQVRQAMVGESARWGDQLRTSPFTRDEHWQKERDGLLANYFPRRSATVLEQLRRAGLYPRTAAPVMNLPGGQVEPGFPLTLSAPQGTVYYTTNGLDPRLPAASGALIYTGPIALHDLTSIKARALVGQEWSALTEASFQVGEPALSLAELHYHPADPSPAERAAGFANADDFEFIELWNFGTGTYDLTGVRFIDGVSFDFTGSSVTRLPAGGRVLIVENQAAFRLRYGADAAVAGEYTGQLSNSGERIELVNRHGETILAFAYGTRAPWPASPDGAGPSLELTTPEADPTDPAHWRASASPGGTPGQPSAATALALELLGFDGRQLRFRFPGQAGLGYTVHVRNSLATGGWREEQRGPPESATQSVEVAVDLLPGEGTRFFRVSIP